MKWFLSFREFIIFICVIYNNLLFRFLCFQLLYSLISTSKHIQNKEIRNKFYLNSVMLGIHMSEREMEGEHGGWNDEVLFYDCFNNEKYYFCCFNETYIPSVK